MNRIIKFRAWDGQDKKMLDFLSANQYNNLLVLQPRNDRFVIQQFTGLLDKNGKEIFEGDVVSGGWGPFTVKGFVEYGHGYFGINTGGDAKNLIPLGQEKAFGHDCIEVIGNIYENNDLISDKK